MRDWSALVRPHLASLRVDERRRLEIGAELAAHLEDAYTGARRSGCTDAEAMACAMERGWTDPRWYVHALAASLALLFYLVLGAIGAAWSRHVGGSPGERLAAGAFPLVLHAAVVGLGVGADVLFALSQGGRGRHLGLHLDINVLNMVLVMLVAPGAALLLGVLPFARRHVRLDT